METYVVRRRAFWIALLVGCGGMAGGCTLNPVTGKRELTLISRQQEIAMGVAASKQFEGEFGGRVPDPILQDYVRAVGTRVGAHSDREMPYEFTVVASKVPNAFALPGGKIFITAGLLSLMANEQQLAAVLGHEIGHVSARHNVNGMQRQMGAAVLVKIAGQIAGDAKGEIAEKAAQVVTSMANLKYSRDNEYQADELGAKYMTGAGYNPWGMVELLELLMGLSEKEPGALAEMFQTHPLTGKRIAQAKAVMDRNYRSFSPSAADPRARAFRTSQKRLMTMYPGLRR